MALNLDNNAVSVVIRTTYLTAYCREHLPKLSNGEINYQEVLKVAYEHMTEALATEICRLVHEEYEKRCRLDVPDDYQAMPIYVGVPVYFLLSFRDLQTIPIPSSSETCNLPVRRRPSESGIRTSTRNGTTDAE